MAHGRRVKHADMNLLELVSHWVISVWVNGKGDTVSDRLKQNCIADCVASADRDMMMYD